MFALIERLHGQGLAILLVEQNVMQSLRVAARAYVLENGRFAALGTRRGTGGKPRTRKSLSGNVTMTEEMDASRKLLSLKSRIAQGGVVLAPGVYDALTASLAASAGFEALYLSGAAIAYTRLGRPDIGLVSSSEVADALAHVCERVETPVIVDADTGYGNALNVERTVRLFERAGAAAIQLEDQTFPKRCGHLDGKSVVPMQEMVGKIHAAVDARRRTQTLIIARTDAVAVEGFDVRDRARRIVTRRPAPTFSSSRRRGRASSSARSRKPWAIARRCSQTWSKAGRRRSSRGPSLEALGFRLVIFPGAIVRALAQAARDFYGVLKRDGTTEAFRDRMFDFEALNGILGTADMLARGRAYESGDRTQGTGPMSALDPVTLAVLKGRLEQIADEMDATLYRSAFNPIIAEARDACHGLYHAETGATLVQGTTGLPIFVGAMAFAVKAVIDKVARRRRSRGRRHVPLQRPL